MHIAIDINTDLSKLKLVIENLKMKINKSELARKFQIDRRTISKNLDGSKHSKARKKHQKLMRFTT